MIRLALADSRTVRVERAPGVSDDVWLDLWRLLVPERALAWQQPLSVPLPRILSQRTRLAQLLDTHSIGLELDESLRAILERARAEEAELQNLMAQPFNEVQAVENVGGRFRRSLTWFQQRDLARLIRLPHGANFSVPGAGKTTTTYALYELERLRGRVAQLVVVAPLSAFTAWETEAQECFLQGLWVQRFTGGYVPAHTEVLLVNYQRLASAINSIADWCMRGPTHVVLDEAHRMKRGRPGVWAGACLDLSLVAARRDVLTGTPAPNKPGDLIAILDYLWPRPGGRRLLPEAALVPRPTDWAMRQLNQQLQPLFVRTTKGDLGLQPIRLTVVTVEMGALQTAIYTALRRQYVGGLDLDRRDAAMLGRMGEATMHLLQAATNPKLLAGGPMAGIAYRYPPSPLANPRIAALIEECRYHEHEMPPKWIQLARILRDNQLQGRKTLVWSNFPENLLDLERQLVALQPALIYGAIPSEHDNVPEGTRTRESELRRFCEDPDCWVLLANPQALGEGVSLHRVCHDAVYLDRTFNAGQYLQSLDRIHRLGLGEQDETRVTILVSSSSVDETVERRVMEKADRLSQILNDPHLVELALPDDEDAGAILDSEADLIALFDHLASEEPPGE